MRNTNATSLVLDLFRIGCIGLLASMARTSLASEVSYGAQATCHQSTSAALAACQRSATLLQLDNDVTAVDCFATLGGYQLEVGFSIGSNVIAGKFFSEAAGASTCSSEFQEERTNAQEISNLATSLNDLDNYTQTQFTTVNQNFGDINADLGIIEQTLQTFASDIGANTVSAAAHEARLNGIDQTLVTIDGEQVDLANTQALIQSDIGALQIGQGNLATSIAANELYIQGVEAEQQTYESARAASDAATNTALATTNTLLQTNNDKLDAVTVAQQQNENAIGISHGKFDQQIAYLSTLNPKLDDISNYTRLTWETQGNSFTMQQDMVSRLAAIDNALGTRPQQQIDWLSNVNTRVTQSNDLLTQIRDNQGSIEITGENINIDNSGVENRLDAILTEVSTVPVSHTSVTDSISDSQSETYNSIQGVPVIQAFTGLSNIWTGSVNDFTCPVASMDLSETVIGTTVVMDSHCTLINNIYGTWSLILQLSYAFTAIFIFMRA